MSGSGNSPGRAAYETFRRAFPGEDWGEWDSRSVAEDDGHAGWEATAQAAIQAAFDAMCDALAAERDRLTERVAELVSEGNQLRAENREMRHLNTSQGFAIHDLHDQLNELANQLEASAYASAPSKKSEIERKLAADVRAITIPAIYPPAIATAGTGHLAAQISETGT